jgi:plasmid segregation protein ParM
MTEKITAKKTAISNAMNYIVKNDLQETFESISKKTFKDIKGSIGALDIGYGNTKYLSGVNDECELILGSFPSLTPLASSNKIGGNMFMSRDTHVVNVDETLYEVGVESEDLISGSNTDAAKVLDESYIFTAQYKALFLGALAYMNVEEFDVLVMGLPVNYIHNADKLAELFTDTFELPNNKKCKINKIVVIPQPLGGFYQVAIDHELYEDMLGEFNLVIDPGYLTFDVLTTKGLTPIDPRSDAIPGGMSKILNALAKSVSEELGKNYDDLNAIDKGIRKMRKFKNEDGDTVKRRAIKVGKKIIELDPHIKKMIPVIENSIIAMKNIVKTYDDIENIILVGGAENIFYKRIEKHLVDREIFKADNALYSNVIGFFYVGVIDAIKS